MSTRALIAYPYRDGFKAAWVWVDGMPANLGVQLRNDITTLEQARQLIKFGNISAVLDKDVLATYVTTSSETLVNCRAFNTRNELDAYLQQHRQLMGNAVKTLKSGLLLLCDKSDAAIAACELAYYVTKLSSDMYILQREQNISTDTRFDKTNFVYYRSLADMRDCDIDYIYVFSPDKGKWVTHRLTSRLTR